MKKTLWQPVMIGFVFGLLGGITSAAGLTFLTTGISNNAIGFYSSLFLLAAALGGPLGGILSSAFFLLILAGFGQPEMKVMLTDPHIFWPNLFSLGFTLGLLGWIYRPVYERFNMPMRLLPWAGIIAAYYVINIPLSIIPQNLLLGDPRSEILPSILYGYQTYLPQAIFDFMITSLIFIALPKRYRRLLWIRQKPAVLPPKDMDEIREK